MNAFQTTSEVCPETYTELLYPVVRYTTCKFDLPSRKNKYMVISELRRIFSSGMDTWKLIGFAPNAWNTLEAFDFSSNKRRVGGVQFWGEARCIKLYSFPAVGVERNACEILQVPRVCTESLRTSTRSTSVHSYALSVLTMRHRNRWCEFLRRRPISGSGQSHRVQPSSGC